MASFRTKYAVGDWVWFDYEGRAKQGQIRHIFIEVGDLVSIEYDIKIGSYLIERRQTEVFPTEEKLKKAMK